MFSAKGPKSYFTILNTVIWIKKIKNKIISSFFLCSSSSSFRECEVQNAIAIHIWIATKGRAEALWKNRRRLLSVSEERKTNKWRGGISFSLAPGDVGLVALLTPRLLFWLYCWKGERHFIKLLFMGKYCKTHLNNHCNFVIYGSQCGCKTFFLLISHWIRLKNWLIKSWTGFLQYSKDWERHSCLTVKGNFVTFEQQIVFTSLCEYWSMCEEMF